MHRIVPAGLVVLLFATPALAADGFLHTLVSRVFRAPPPEAVGAAIGATFAVQIALYLRRRAE